MTSKLDSAVILRLMREERSKHLENLHEEIDVVTKVDGVQKKVVSPGLKVRTKKDNMLCTIVAVSKDAVVMVDPNGKRTNVTDKELEAGYEID